MRSRSVWGVGGSGCDNYINNTHVFKNKFHKIYLNAPIWNKQRWLQKMRWCYWSSLSPVTNWKKSLKLLLSDRLYMPRHFYSLKLVSGALLPCQHHGDVLIHCQISRNTAFQPSEPWKGILTEGQLLYLVWDSWWFYSSLFVSQWELLYA